jgi:D-beta-D-heptose 7-phosphate kinase/D-beta-D-heptose 1-phosphate adenosyltransferase
MRIAFFGDAFEDVFTPVVEVKINPESGCPAYVLDSDASRSYPGGVANAARAIQHFDVETRLYTPGPCERKERLVYKGNQVARLDTPLPTASELTVVLSAFTRAVDLDAVVVSDYGRGAVTSHTLSVITGDCRRRGIPCVIDAKRIISNVDMSGTVLKCNEPEARGLGMEMDGRSVAGFGIRHDCGLVVTRQERPPIVGPVELPAIRMPSRPFQSSGAGDSFAAFLAWGLANGFHLHHAAGIAYQYAAAAGFFPPFREPLLPHEVAAIEDPACLKVLDNDRDLAAWLRHRAPKRLVVTNGCFDVLHSGHVRNLTECRGRGDALLVLVNSDESVKRLKGPGRPAQQLADRMRALAGLEAINAISSFSEDRPAARLAWCVNQMGRTFSVLAKGGDYCHADLADQRPYAERLHFTRRWNVSTSSISRQINACHVCSHE